MTRTTYLARTAGSAIAAALALASTPLLAQQAAAPEAQPQSASSEPAATVPAPTAETSQPATIILPPLPAETASGTATTPPQDAQPTGSTATQSQAPVMRSAPVVQELPEPDLVVETEPEPALAPTAVQTENVAPRAPAEPTATPREASAAPVDTGEVALPENATLPDTLLPVAQAEPALATPDLADTSAEEVTANQTELLTWLLAGLGIGGLALLLLMVARRRRTPPVPRIAPYRPATESVPRSATAPTDTKRDTNSAQAAGPLEIAAARASTDLDTKLPTTGASTPLPRRKPETVEGRKELIDRIAAAKPDRANPFRSIKARRRRARLIVQSLDNSFPNGSRIDFSQYPANWPHLARREDTVAA